MTSWGGTSMVTVLKSILTILSTNGHKKKSPGPLGPPWTLPSLKITPRSYSLTTLMALSMTDATTMTTTTRAMNAKPTLTACNKPKVVYTKDPPLFWPVEFPTITGQFDWYHLHYPSLAETYNPHLAPHPYHGLGVLRVGHFWGERQHSPPQLPVHEHPSLRSHSHGAPYGANLADHPLLARKCRPPFGGPQRSQDPEEHAPHEHRDYHECAEQHPRVGDARPKERQASGKERYDAPRGKQAVVG